MISRFILAIIRLYQVFVSPLMGNRCRFYPSCSNYAISSLKKYKPLKAVVKISGRLLRCNPFHPGGVDIP